MTPKIARADVTPLRQRSQYSCMAASMAMCLRALGHQCDEDEVNRVMGARPMKGASWESALACAQHYGARATLVVPSTVAQLKAWTDQGIPVMIAWNPCGREWSHASVVFDVDDAGNVSVADPNIPDPTQTVSVVSSADFYAKWFEKWPNYLVRRPAMAIEREITPDGRQVMASRKVAKVDPTAPSWVNLDHLVWLDLWVKPLGWHLKDTVTGRIVGTPKDGFDPDKTGRNSRKGQAFYHAGDPVIWGPQLPRLAKKLDTIWCVRDATPDSELGDILFEADANALARIVVGTGVATWKEEHTTLHDDKVSAMADAKKRLNTRDNAKKASYSENPDGKPIYPVDVDHGYDEALSGGFDTMQKLVNTFRREQDMPSVGVTDARYAVSVLARAFAGGGDRAPNYVSASDKPHMRRCVAAGLVAVRGHELVLTPAGKAAIA